MHEGVKFNFYAPVANSSLPTVARTQARLDAFSVRCVNRQFPRPKQREKSLFTHTIVGTSSISRDRGVKFRVNVYGYAAHVALFRAISRVRKEVRHSSSLK